MEMMVVEHFHHPTTEVPLQVGNRFQAEKRCSPCASQASSFHRCVGNGAITPAFVTQPLPSPLSRWEAAMVLNL
jgi:hypothetical protein